MSTFFELSTFLIEDYADDLELLANTSAQAETHRASLYVNANKTEFMCFKQEGAVSTLSGRPIKLIDKITYLSSNISSTESDVTCLVHSLLRAQQNIFSIFRCCCHFV